MTGAERKRVFVVDDEQIIATTLELILKQAGYDAHAFFEPQSAMRQMTVDRPHLVISDVVMPGMTGIELAMKIGSDFPHCKVILFSGQAQTSELIREARNRGHEFEVLAKPVHPRDLLLRVGELLV